jgi:DNA-binding NarL/FixJ family response regulator
MSTPTSNRLRVVVADDSNLVREAISYLLRSDPDVELVASCADAHALTAAVAAERPDLVVIGVGLARSAGGERMAVGDRLRAASPELGILEIGHEPRLRGALPGMERRTYLRKGPLLDREHLAAALRDVSPSEPTSAGRRRACRGVGRVAPIARRRRPTA